MIFAAILFLAQAEVQADLRATIHFERPPKAIPATLVMEPRIYWGQNPPEPPRGFCWMTWADRPWYLIHAFGDSTKELRELGAQ